MCTLALPQHTYVQFFGMFVVGVLQTCDERGAATFTTRPAIVGHYWGHEEYRHKRMLKTALIHSCWPTHANRKICAYAVEGATHRVIAVVCSWHGQLCRRLDTFGCLDFSQFLVERIHGLTRCAQAFALVHELDAFELQIAHAC